MTTRFTITYDYLCPFAHIANEMVADALAQGKPYEVLFAPFSLHQNSRAETDPPVWDDPGGIDGPGVRALLWSLAVRDAQPANFLPFHLGLFNARHDAGADLGDVAVIRGVASACGVDVPEIEGVVRGGAPMEKLRSEHLWLSEEYGVFGVPTFISGDEAVFVRLMERHTLNDLERVVDQLQWTSLNEFKRTRIPR